MAAFAVSQEWDKHTHSLYITINYLFLGNMLPQNLAA